VGTGTKCECFANGFANKSLGTSCYEVERVGRAKEERPNNQGLLGIRTNGEGQRITLFKTGALNHSATLPSLRHQSLSFTRVKNGL
jgi:hypothetical protein